MSKAKRHSVKSDEWMEPVRNAIPDLSERCLFWEYLHEYQISIIYGIKCKNELPNKPGSKIAFAFIKPQIDAMCDAYVNRAEKMRENGRKHTKQEENADCTNLEQLGDNKRKEKNNNKYITSTSSSTTTSSSSACARESLHEWIKNANIDEWIKNILNQHGISITISEIIEEFYNGDIVVRERCARGERVDVIKHFQNWLPKFLKAIKNK